MARSYVLKLHRDARPDDGNIAGRLEHLASGRYYDFHSGAELVACLVRELSQLVACDGGRDSAAAMDTSGQPEPKRKDRAPS
jgi:hypothetical protein